LFRNYHQAKEDLLKALQDLMAVARRRDGAGKAVELSELAGRLETNTFHLVILGQFKRGKSTLINALLGAEVLPTGVIPLTCIATRIRYGEKVKAEVEFKDRRRQEIPLEQVADYVAEKHNPANRKGVEVVDITYPSPTLADGVVLIDTPGVGSTYRHNTDVAYEYLPRVDAALFLVSADPPISEAELGFLREARRYAGKIFFLQNKIDYLEEAEQEESLAFTRQVIQGEMNPHQAEVYPLSARLALEGKLSRDEQKLRASRLPEFEALLERFLMQEKGHVLLASVKKGTARIAAELDFALEVQRKALETPLNELLDKTERLKHQLEKIRQDQADYRYLLKGEVDRLMEGLQADLERLKEAKTREIFSLLEEHARKNNRLGARALIQALEELMQKAIREAFDSFRETEGRKLEEQYRKVVNRFAARANETVEGIRALAARFFDIRLEKLEPPEAFTAEGDFYYRLEDEEHLLTLDRLTISAALPRALAHRMILEEMRKKVAMMVDRHCGRVRYDFYQRVEGSLRQFAARLHRQVGATLETVSNALDRALQLKKESQAQLDAALAKIDHDRRIIRKARERIASAGSAATLLS